MNGLILMIISAFVTHWLDLRQLKKKQKLSYQEKLGEKIADSLIHVRETVGKLNSMEALQVPNDECSHKIGTFSENAFYPTIMNDNDTFLKYCLEVSNARTAYEPYLNRKCSAYLFVLERYLSDLALYIKATGGGLQYTGCIAIIDLQKIGKQFDSVLVNEINHPHYAIQKKKGRVWEREKGKAIKELRNGCFLDELREIANTIIAGDTEIVADTVSV